MAIFAVTGLLSAILFGLAVLLFLRADTTPSLRIRTESRRSPEEYAHHRQQTRMRRGGYMLAMAATMNLGVCITMGLVLATSD